MGSSVFGLLVDQGGSLVIRFGAWMCGLMVLVAGPALAQPEKANLKSPQILYLSIQDYVNLVLRQGDEAMTAYKNFENSVFDKSIALRQLWLPTLSLSGDVGKDKADLNGAITRTASAEGSATVSQPVYPTGGSVSASYSEDVARTDESDGSVSRSYTRPTYTARYTQPLFLFVGNSQWRSWKRSRLNYEIASDSYRSELLSLENSARARYYDALLKAAQLSVEKSKMDSSRRGHAITKALVDAGRMASIELSRSDLRLRQDVRRYKNAETAHRQAVNSALEMASLSLDTQIDFTSRLDYRPLDQTLEGLLSLALEHRPDYRAAKRRLDLGQLSVKEAQEDNNPQLNAVASVSKSEFGDGSDPDSIRRSWEGGLSLNWPLFDSGVTRLRVKSAVNDLEAQRIAFVGLERNIRTEVANAFLDLKRTEEQLDDLRSSKEQARRSVEAVRIRYQNGRDRLIDVFDSEQQLRDLELEYLNVLISANLAKDQLALLVGTPLEGSRQ